MYDYGSLEVLSPKSFDNGISIIRQVVRKLKMLVELATSVMEVRRSRRYQSTPTESLYEQVTLENHTREIPILSSNEMTNK